MAKLLTSRASVVIAATLFAAATWLTSSSDLAAPTTLVLTQPIELSTLASR